MRSVLLVLALTATTVQSQAPQFGGGYSTLDTRQRALVDNWSARFEALTRQQLGPAAFYDAHLGLSAKTTFEAVTHALKTTALSDETGAPLGDALALIDQLDAVKGQITGAGGDQQFRMYVRLIPSAADTLTRSREFRRGMDNTVYHNGYPINYREQGGTPSIQISMARDSVHADIDVDYRSSSFPTALFNGHLTSSNSDVRAGSNYNRHVSRWTGFQNWWKNFFGVRIGSAAEESGEKANSVLLGEPRIGKERIEAMVGDFLRAWLVDGDAVAAANYVSERAFACLAEDSDDPATFDRGMAPVQLVLRLRAAYQALGPHATLDGLTVGIRLPSPALRVVTQPHHAQYVISEVPDDIAVKFDCGSRQAIGSDRPERRYGQYHAATFYVDGPSRDVPIALLWAKDHGFWKIVSWQTEPAEESPSPPSLAAAVVTHVRADPGLARAAKDFLDAWLVRHDPEAAFRYLSPASYACYELVRGPDQPAAATPEDAGRRIRENMARAGDRLGRVRALDAVIRGAEPIVDSVRILDHPSARAFTLTAIPNAVADAVECTARARGARLPDAGPPEYGAAFGMNVRFVTRGGEAPVLRMIWRRESGGWRITSYDVELP